MIPKGEKNKERIRREDVEYKIHSKQIKNLNVRPETTKLLEKNRGSTLFDINHSKILFDLPPRITEIKTKINKFLHSKRNNKHY